MVVIEVVVVIVVVPVLLIVPAMLVFVPPFVVFIPAVLAGFVQFAAGVIGFRTGRAVVLYRLVQVVVGMFDAVLAIVVFVGARAWHTGEAEDGYS